FCSSRRRHTRSDRDWSSDVCSSDLAGRDGSGAEGERKEGDGQGKEAPKSAQTDERTAAREGQEIAKQLERLAERLGTANGQNAEIGRASCRERVKSTVDADIIKEYS